jgi:ABC-2 type transport system ATP-binding protein
VTAWCASHGVLAEQLSTGTASLEDLFIALTGNGASA